MFNFKLWDNFKPQKILPPWLFEINVITAQPDLTDAFSLFKGGKQLF